MVSTEILAFLNLKHFHEYNYISIKMGSLVFKINIVKIKSPFTWMEEMIDEL